MPLSVLRAVDFTNGKYISVSLSIETGQATGNIHPPGWAFQVNNDGIIDDEIILLSSRNQVCRGKWFICAASEEIKFDNLLCPDVFFGCQLILVMGVSMAKPYNPFHSPLLVHYYKMRNKSLQENLRVLSINATLINSSLLCLIVNSTVQVGKAWASHSWIRYLEFP